MNEVIKTVDFRYDGPRESALGSMIMRVDCNTLPKPSGNKSWLARERLDL